MTHSHETYMTEALKLAARGKGRTSPNPMVGAVVVKDGSIVGKGYHECYGGPHAEVNAIDDAGDNAEGADLYVTLEPCNHTGKTPPCTQKILDARIKKVIVAMADPNPHVKGGGNSFLKQKGVDVECGVLEKKAIRLNEAFIKHIRTKTPFVILKCASTLDGRIAASTGDSKWVTGEAARRHVHEIRHEIDAIMVGKGTVLADNPSLTTRLPDRDGVDPIRVIVDTRLSLSTDARIFHQDSNVETFVAAGEPYVTDEKLKTFETLGNGKNRIIISPLKDGRIDLNALMNLLGEINIQSLLIEGGSTLIHSVINNRIADKVMFYIAPKILSGDDGYPVSKGTGPLKMADALTLKNIRTQRFGDDILIEGYTS